MKKTNKKTVFCFRSEINFETAKGILIFDNIPFNASIGKRMFLKINPELVLKYSLTTLLVSDLMFSEYSVK